MILPSDMKPYVNAVLVGAVVGLMFSLVAILFVVDLTLA